MATLFRKIALGEVPCHKIAEDSQFMAFLDINPNAKGHTLCIPKKEIESLLDMEEEMYQELMRFSRKVGLALQKTIPCKKIGMAVIGLEVPHVHVHLIPLQSMDDMKFDKKIAMNDEEFKELAASIHVNL